MKLTSIFLFLFLLLPIPFTYLAAQVRRDSAVKKTTPGYRTSRVPKPAQNRSDTTPKPLPPVQTNPTHDDGGKDDKPRQKYITPDTIRPVQVETRTYVGSVLRLQKIYVNSDALELIQLLNPGLADKQTVMSDYKLVLPELPEPDYKSNRSVNKQFKRDLDPDANTNNIFTGSSLQLDTLANIFNTTNFDLEDVNDQNKYRFIKSMLPALADLNKRATTKIHRTSKTTVNILTKETNALNNILLECSNSSTLSSENINAIYSLMEDMNILLFGITDRKLQIPRAGDGSYYHKKQPDYYLASYNLSSNNEKEYKSTLSDDDPRKFNIYIFRRSLVESGRQDPEMKAYSVSYAIPALAGDKDEWTEIPEPASTVKCYFAPARFKFTITDLRTGDVYSTTEDLYDAQKDPDEKWTIMDLFNRHPTYRLIFLIP